MGFPLKLKEDDLIARILQKCFLNDSYRQSVVFASLLIESFSIYLLRITNFSNMLENELLLWINPWISGLYLPNSRDGIFFLLMQTIRVYSSYSRNWGRGFVIWGTLYGKIFFFKTQSTRLRTIVALNKGLK